jgi:hypothetical protein
MSKLFVDQVDPKTATTLTLGTSGDTVTVPTGVGLTVTDEVKTNKISPASGTAFTLGDSGDTFTIPSGVTLANAGTATGFGISSYWSASRNSGQSVAQNTATTILWNVVTTATNVTSTLTSDGKITIAAGQAGWYVVTAINRYADGPTDGKEKMTIKWFDHSASSTETIGYAEINTKGTYDTMVATGLKYLDVNDYVYISVNQNNDSSANFIGGNGTGFYGYRIA